jgi:hypothetical protein
MKRAFAREGFRMPGAFAALAPFVLGFGGCSSDPDSRTNSAFASYYADSTAYCSRQVDCELSTRVECERYWPTTSRVEQAIELAELDSSYLEKCEAATRRLDGCNLALSCAELADNGNHCTSELERFNLVCASLIEALEQLEPTPESPAFAEQGIGDALCNRVEECDGGTLSPSDRTTCVDLTNQAFGIALPDPAATAACIARAACAELMANTEPIVRGCIDIDAAATACSSERVLRVCNQSGACRDVDCPAACAFVGTAHLSCGFEEQAGYDKCTCSE